MTANKYEARKWRAKLADVLGKIWDPIGVGAADEYEGYAGKVASLVREGASDEAIRQYLTWAEAEHMGFGKADSARLDRTLRAIRELGPIP
jgi:hypothetical protein